MYLETIAFLGFVSGIVHHVIFQFPQQKSLIVTLSGFWVMELTFLAILFNEHAFSFLSFSLFTTIYVSFPIGHVSNLRSGPPCFSRRFIMYISDIVESLENSGFALAIGPFTDSIRGKHHTEKLQKCMMK
jgi:hypothetical protein